MKPKQGCCGTSAEDIPPLALRGAVLAPAPAPVSLQDGDEQSWGCPEPTHVPALGCASPFIPWDEFPLTSGLPFPLRRAGPLLPAALQEIPRCWEETPCPGHAGAPRDCAPKLKQSDNTCMSCLLGELEQLWQSQGEQCSFPKVLFFFFTKPLKSFLTSALYYTTI